MAHHQVTIVSKNEDGTYNLDTGVILTKMPNNGVELKTFDIFTGIPEYSNKDLLAAIDLWEEQNV